MPRDEVCRALWRAAVLRGLAALALGVYAISRDPASIADIVHATALYWIADGLVTVRAARLGDALALSRLVFLVRGVIAIATGLVILALPRGLVFGPWQFGQLLVWVVVVALLLTVIGFQIGVGAFDVLVCREIRHRFPGEWSAALAVAFSGALAVIAAATVAAPPMLLGRILSVGAVVVGFVFLVGAARLGAGRVASPVMAYPRKR